MFNMNIEDFQMRKYNSMNKLFFIVILIQLCSSIKGLSRLIPNLESISIVQPVLTDATGKKIGDIIELNEDNLRSKRQTDHTSNNDTGEKIYISISHNSEEFLLELMLNRNLITPHTLIEWVLADGNKLVKKLSSHCYYFGKNIKTKEPSMAAVSNCNGLTGYIQTSNQSYFIEPLSNELRKLVLYGSSSKEPNPYDRTRNRKDFGFSGASPRSHVIYSVKTALKKLNLSVQKDQEFRKRRMRRTVGSSFPPFGQKDGSRFMKGGKRMAFLYKGSSLKSKLPDKYAKAGIGGQYSQINCKRHGKHGRQSGKSITNDDIVCKEKTQRRLRNAEMREHRKIIRERRRREREKRKGERKRRKLEKERRKQFRRKLKIGKHLRNKKNINLLNDFSDDTKEVIAEQKLKETGAAKWLEISVGIDHTVIDFHGEENVEKYVLTLFNIVSAIYGDPSLESNLQIVLLRLIFYKDKSYSQVKKGLPKKSLESVNRWAKRLFSASPDQLKHDLAVWLTKYDLGGPSGYAPVSGICEPKRSCTLNKDEGLTSAFIIAHEMGHVLGMSHDGDTIAGNNCESNGFNGLVMAPLVAATFGRFHWSPCSKAEYHRLIKSWHCLSNKPTWENATAISARIKYQYTLDDQCRMEFGEGYSQCKRYGMSDPCIYLWCANNSAPTMCKTKKGPPLEGTICGPDKWCHRGFCRTISKINYDYSSVEDSGNEVLPLSARNHSYGNSEWNKWSEWQPCSRTCGIGISTRSRTCNNPETALKGSLCTDKRQEWKTCSTHKCLIQADLRSQQCHQLKYLVKLNRRKANLSWLPYESRKERKKCKLTCISRFTKEVYLGRDNLLDGTKCSYDSPDRICMQGRCVTVGCNGNMTSLMKTDGCGICGGDNSTCIQSSFVYKDLPLPEYSEVILLPKGAYKITVQEDSPFYGFLALRDSLSNIVLNGYKNQGAGADVITEGVMFHYYIVNGREIIKASGPLLNPVAVLIHGGIIREVSKIITTYTISRRDTSAKWEMGPHTPCSASCDGGMQQETIVCRDLHSDKQVSDNNCQHLDKPYLQSRTCNLFRCKFEWLSSPWQRCSANCGFNGIQTRTVSCVRSQILYPVIQFQTPTILDSIFCSGRHKPDSERACNRIKCPKYWRSNGWSQCSVTCGLGHQARKVLCVGSFTNETSEDCGHKPSTEMRVCVYPSCPLEECQDESKFCAIHYLKRYCTIPKYRKMCCLSCNETT